jgi:uncharacterized membrane protein YkoI
MGKILSLLGVCMALGCSQMSDPLNSPSAARGSALADERDGEERISLDDVPANIKQVAQDRVPGIVLEAAARETENGTLVYELTGTANGERYEIEVTAAGQVTEVEHGDEDGEHEDGAEDDR